MVTGVRGGATFPFDIAAIKGPAEAEGVGGDVSAVDEQPPEDFDQKAVQPLAQRVLSTLTSVQTIRSHGIMMPYPSDVLLAMFYELKAISDELRGHRVGTQMIHSLGYFLAMPTERTGTILEDSVALFIRAGNIPSPQEVMNLFTAGLVRSQLAEKVEFTDEDGLRLILLYQHARNVANNGVDGLMKAYMHLFPVVEDTLPRFMMVDRDFEWIPEMKDGEIVESLNRAFAARPRVWEYESADGKLVEAALPPNLKSIGEYYGYTDIKRTLGRYFGDFSRGQRMRPITLVGPPGVGKTHLPIVFAQLHNNLQLVTVPQREMSDLRTILDSFKDRTGRFVVVIDDVDVVEDHAWAPFRAIFEGAGNTSPENVLLVISSNKPLPDNVRARSLPIDFPDLSQPKTARETVLGIVMDYVRQQDTAQTRSEEDTKLLATFIVHDYYNGEVYKELSTTGGQPELHQFDRSPRGLINYLGMLSVSGRWEQIHDRMARYKRHSTGSAGGVDEELRELGVEIIRGG